MGERHLAARQVAHAIDCYARAVELEPTAWRLRVRLGRLLLSIRQFDAAETEFRRACAIVPGLPDLQVLHAYALREQNEADAAVAALQRALAIDPQHMHATIAEALMLPPVYSGHEDLQRWRERFESGLMRLHAGIATWRQAPLPILDLDWSNFLLAYQGENDLNLQRGYSRFLAALLEAAVPGLRQPVEASRGEPGRIRVGFVSSEFRISTVGQYFLRWITDLPRDRFHVATFYTGSATDELTRDVEGASDTFAQQAGNAAAVAKTVRDARLDIVVLPDVGMSAKSMLLANLRLARAQCAAWGHPVSTGSDCVEYFISCQAMEPVDAQAHYSEKLITLPGIGVRYRPAAATGVGTRAQFGLPRDRHVYLCPQSLCKIHPDNDALFIALVERDTRALIVFFDGQAKGQTLAFAKRLEQAMRRRGVPPRQQFKFLPRMGRAPFLDVMKVSDVMIDTLRWSGGNTTLDALSSGLPIVTLEGRYMRGRQTAAMLRILGVEELIAADADQYLALAQKVASETAYRSALALRIRTRLPDLLDRSEPSTALASALERIAAE